tara:strand:+ start:536 stop:1222 length:687 start_codon:yes stop_codon:yes gene_type:complete
MNFDILNKLEEILNEENSWEKVKENQNQFIADSRSRGTYHQDLEKNLKEDEEESNDTSEEKVDDKEEMIDDTPDESPSTINLADADNFDKLKSILNQFRASHSLSKKSVHEDLEKYFDKLTGDEKKALHVFLKGLVQITLLDVNGKAAYSPKDLKIIIGKSEATESELKRSQSRKDQLEDLQDMPKEKAEEKLASPIPVIKVGNIAAGVEESIQEKKEIIEFLKKINS